MSKRRQLNIRLTQETQELLERLISEHHLTKTQAVLQGLQALERELDTYLDRDLDTYQEHNESVNETQERTEPEIPYYWPAGRFYYGIGWTLKASELPSDLREYCEVNGLHRVYVQERRFRNKYYIDWDS